MLQAGQLAPDFTLPDQNGTPVTLSDYNGRKRIVYFYPRDNTPGCTRQACAFAAAQHVYAEHGIIVIGISKDSVASHTRFAQKYDLPFLLLSDPERTAIESYGVWQEKKSYGKTSMGVVRTTFYIDEQGVIQKVWPKAKPDTNAQETLAYLGLCETE
ncbi:MAG: thioredoxin-dependent thiol peroxidase [Clostridiales bacterium]|nr:MAG: thioredoxin-dependent thiol peroxidase [Clostridiales bacterium]